MDSNKTRTLHPREVLRQVADSMNGQRNELSVTLPAHTTWKSAIRAAEAALGDIDGSLLLMPRGTGNRRLLRKTALQLASESPSENVLGRPIRTNVDLKTAEPRPPISEAARERLRNMAKEAAKTEFREPYASLRPALGEGHLPIIRADLILRGMDSNETDPIYKLEGINMIFDTGAHQTIIADELLPTSFREYLKDSVHDPYRSSNGLVLQIDAAIALTNCPVTIEAVAVIMPKAKMPNKLVGVLFGQFSCIDRLSLRAIPRQILLAKGEEISEEHWGDIVAEEYLNLDDEIVSL
ncbi:uncharacterized protein P174DRAFT_450380 [Aspergillus novofumigatus IBT 16806]|uniref:Peptidase A2 domain-containing protein n=1 Tax=Aspergillus novofumigatus (strain IBT 16806) TaxID=1392255 RepID=A0A2I1CEL8_ASPN1|nr:uncharacterized protein P174DRAFT_450380 [Aspergillus novofumigatus IBT 16806]PKX96066.1 hypothetical protein P174DRAFT_450380 [Aspergillus novofumigatus IBT 16806]